jgi:hypothetical protein
MQSIEVLELARSQEYLPPSVHVSTPTHAERLAMLPAYETVPPLFVKALWSPSAVPRSVDPPNLISVILRELRKDSCGHIHTESVGIGLNASWTHCGRPLQSATYIPRSKPCSNAERCMRAV